VLSGVQAANTIRGRPLLDGVLDPKGVRVGRVDVALIEIARVAEEAEIDLALLAVVEEEAEVRDVLERLLLRLFLRDLTGDEFPAAAVVRPDAAVVVAPGLSEQTRGGSHRPYQRDACRRVRGTVLALAFA